MRNVLLALLAIGVTGCASTNNAENSVATDTEKCVETNEQKIEALFIDWNEALKTGNPAKVVDNYAARSVLLPTMESDPLVLKTVSEKEKYFRHFMEREPVGNIDSSFIVLGCNTAIRTGLYTFTLKKPDEKVDARYTFTYKWDGEKKKWLITSHHSSKVPK